MDVKKKKKGDMDPKYKEAKMSVLKEIRKMATDEMGKDVKGLQQVTVAEPNERTLRQGYEQVEQTIDGQGAEPDNQPGSPDVPPDMFDHGTLEKLSPRERDLIKNILYKMKG